MKLEVGYVYKVVHVRCLLGEQMMKRNDEG